MSFSRDGKVLNLTFESESITHLSKLKAEHNPTGTDDLPKQQQL